MLAKIIPVLFLVLGVGAGIGAGHFLSPTDAAISEGSTIATGSNHDASNDHEGEGAGVEFIKLNNQFVVPVVQGDKIAALVVLSLSLEALNGLREEVYAREPKLRDAFLQVLFDHANMGGFDGSFTNSELLDLLRTALREVAQKELGKDVINVLIIDIARQDT